MLREAWEKWEPLHIMRIRGCEVVVFPPAMTPGAVAASPHGPAAQAVRIVALLSLFDGAGMARVGLDD
eukprot:6242009-Lingulodinium_polyedra.AAC.1